MTRGPELGSTCKKLGKAECTHNLHGAWGTQEDRWAQQPVSLAETSKLWGHGETISQGSEVESDKDYYEQLQNRKLDNGDEVENSWKHKAYQD